MTAAGGHRFLSEELPPEFIAEQSHALRRFQPGLFLLTVRKGYFNETAEGGKKSSRRRASSSR